MNRPPLIKRFAELGMADLATVGGKNASLGEMFRSLASLGVRVPDGFAVTADAYRGFLDHNALVPVIRESLSGLDLDDVASLQRRGQHIRKAILAAELPDELAAAIAEAYDSLGDVEVAVRSSATAEDLPDASFAGQQETYLAVHGRAAVLDACRRCYASLFTDRAISYRTQRHFDHLAVALSIGVQRMVRSDLASAGVIFTLDPESGFRDVVLVTSSWGLGETVVQGTVAPDEFLVHKPTLAQGFRPLVRRVLGSKESRLVYADGPRGVRSESVPADERAKYSLTDDEVLTLARHAVIIEDHYGRIAGRPVPMDIEWAKDGRTGELFVVQARPETVQSRRGHVIERYRLDGQGPVIARGRAVGDRIGSGRARVVRDVRNLSDFEDGDVLVAERTDPDWEPVMRRAAAVVTDHGGRTCHAAIVCRELGKPAVVGCGDATSAIADRQRVTVSGAEGETGIVYDGAVPFHVERVDFAAQARPRTKIMMNLGDPGTALELAQLPNDGVGLLREEFVISSTIGIHPMALADWPALGDPALTAEIDRRTRGYADKSQFFVDRLAEGVGLVAAAFWPRDVIVRLSDFKTNEYAHLLGGARYEATEANPMLGFRGAARYVDPRYARAFRLECLALHEVRHTMGLRNVKVMVPFCRTVAEGRRVLAELARNGLVRGQDGLEVYVMCEIPSNAILVERFAEVFDGFSIGSNDLTQLTLGVDRDSELVASAFDERDAAVKFLIERAIVGAHAAGRKVGICGQAPSDYPEFAQFLVDAGIDSISLDPDAVLRTTALVRDHESAIATR
jgi:pyruvate, water dikinase